MKKENLENLTLTRYEKQGVTNLINLSEQEEREMIKR